MPTIATYNTDTIPTVADTDTVNFEGGSVDVTTGLDLSALATGLSGVNINRGWKTNIGSASTSLKADVDVAATSALTYNALAGAVWFSPSGVSGVCSICRCIGFGTLTLNGTGTVTRLEHGRGRTIVGGNITITNIDLAGGDVVMAAGTAPTTVIVTGGSLEIDRGITTLTVTGGTVIINTTAAITTINFYGGRLIIKRCGTITTFNVFGGDLRQVEISKAVTITNTTIWASVGNMSSFLANTLITFTNAATKRIADHSDWR